MTNYLWQAIASPLRVFSREETKGKLAVSARRRVCCRLARLGGHSGGDFRGSAYTGDNPRLIQAGMLLAFGASILSWLIVCLLFWALSRAFHNGLRFRQVLSVWGLELYSKRALHTALRRTCSFLPECARNQRT